MINATAETKHKKVHAAANNGREDLQKIKKINSKMMFAVAKTSNTKRFTASIFARKKGLEAGTDGTRFVLKNYTPQGVDFLSFLNF